MEFQKIRDELLTSPRAATYAEYVVTNDMPKQDAVAKDKALAAMINDNPELMLSITSTAKKRGDFLRVLGPVDGAALFHKLKTQGAAYEPLAYIVMELEGDGLEITSETDLVNFLILLESQTTIDANDSASIRKVFTEKTIVSSADVSIALRGNAEFTIGVQ